MDIAGCVPLILSWIYHRFPKWCPPEGARDVREGRLLQWRFRIDRVTLAQFRWTSFDTLEIQARISDWMRSQGEVHTWRSAVHVVCFNYVGMHHIDRVIRQYGGEQPVRRHLVDVTRFMTSTARGDDVWWPQRLQTWYDGWQRRKSPEVMVTVHAGGGPRGTRQYYDSYVGAAAGIMFLTRATDLNDLRWNMAPPDIHAEPIHARDELTMPLGLCCCYHPGQSPSTRPRHISHIDGRHQQRQTACNV
ncbi:hypothetical protein PIB30_013822 [Stylosanthes scabra]|uniref:Aminotransferase-like plant mobile domain-containing protein n=1 Tax=Stylosanthes scabra TaxID=79078 RepID=A0ABU6S6H3_9FABA|nr:hypothetical protein [Stylosanthes scabra]